MMDYAHKVVYILYKNEMDRLLEFTSRDYLIYLKRLANAEPVAVSTTGNLGVGEIDRCFFDVISDSIRSLLNKEQQKQELASSPAQAPLRQYYHSRSVAKKKIGVVEEFYVFIKK